MAEFLTCECEIISAEVESSFSTKPNYREYTVRSMVPVVMNRITFKFSCSTISRDMVSNEYSTYVLQESTPQVTKVVFNHSLARERPDLRRMCLAIDAELHHWEFLGRAKRYELIERVVGVTLAEIESNEEDNNFVVSAEICHRLDRMVFEDAVLGMVPAKEEAIRELESEVVEVSGVCSVCMEEMEVGCEAKKMPCCHAFHGECIENWLQISRYCPLCRYQMPHDDDD